MSELTVLGIGNILMSDEGIGVRLLEAVRAARDWPEGIEFVDGGAGGLNLLNLIEEAHSMVVFDAAQMSLSPGEFRVVSPGQLCDEPLDHRASMHDVPLTETLRLCEQFSHRPERIRLLVVQPKNIDFGRALSVELRAVFDKLTLAGVELVEQMAGQP